MDDNLLVVQLAGLPSLFPCTLVLPATVIMSSDFREPRYLKPCFLRAVNRQPHAAQMRAVCSAPGNLFRPPSGPLVTACSGHHDHSRSSAQPAPVHLLRFQSNRYQYITRATCRICALNLSGEEQHKKSSVLSVWYTCAHDYQHI